MIRSKALLSVVQSGSLCCPFNPGAMVWCVAFVWFIGPFFRVCVCVVCVSLCVLYLVYVSSVWFSVFLCGLCTLYLVYVSSVWLVSLCTLFSVCLQCGMSFYVLYVPFI